jgi:hypothetical protein
MYANQMQQYNDRHNHQDGVENPLGLCDWRWEWDDADQPPYQAENKYINQ